MKSFNKLLSSIGFVLLGAILLAANAVAQSAKVLKAVGTGTATVTLNGTKTVVREGAMIPLRAMIETDGNIELYIDMAEGAIATIKKNTRVLLEALDAQTATLDLRQGSVVSQIDPARNVGRKYGVRTPKGVAAAQGTDYFVSVNGQEYMVVTGTGTVSITPVLPGGGFGSPIQITAGGISISTVNGGAMTSAANLAGNTEALAAVNEAASIAVAAIAVVAANPGNFTQGASDTASADLTATMTTVVQQIPGAVEQAVASASQAAPSMAGALVTTAINAAASSGQNVTDMAQRVSQAAAQGAARTTTDAAGAAAYAETIAQAAANAAARLDPANAATIAQNVANAAALGATIGAVQNGQTATNVNSAIAAGAAAGAQRGASTGSGTTVATPVVVPPTVSSTTPTTPVTPIDPSINVSPSGGG